VLASDGPVIYVFFCGRTPARCQIAAFFRCVKKRNPNQSFRLAIVGVKGQHRPPMLLWLRERVSWHTVAEPSKEPSQRWEGDDDTWETVIDELREMRF
jgi:hypothetical protein